jgi:hypothetical protein
MGTWEHRGIFCFGGGRSLKIQREIKREVFTKIKKLKIRIVKK